MNNHMPSRVRDKLGYPMPYLNGCNVEVWEWIIYFTLHFIMDIFFYPWRDLSYSISVKGALGIIILESINDKTQFHPNIDAWLWIS